MAFSLKTKFNTNRNGDVRARKQLSSGTLGKCFVSAHLEATIVANPRPLS